MAKVALAIEKAKPSGISPTKKGALSAADEYQFVNDGQVILRVKNAGAEATDVTVVTPNSVGGLPIEDQKVTVAKEVGEQIIGPFDTSVFNNSEGKVTVKFSKVTGVTVETIRV